MRKIMIILTVFTIIISSCIQTRAKQADEDTQFADAIETVADTDPVFEEVVMNEEPPYHIQKIDSVTYFALKKKAHVSSPELKKITDLELAAKILKGRVIWGEYDENEQKVIEVEESDLIHKIIFDDGKTLSYEDYPEFWFIAYYPDEDILVLEGGHSSTHTFNLSTGEDTDVIGDPEYWLYSPSKRYRFNGYDNGQVNVYFIQEKQADKYETIIEFGYQSKSIILMGFFPEYIPDVFWQNDSTLNFFTPYYYSGGEKENFYYQLVLQDEE